MNLSAPLAVALALATSCAAHAREVSYQGGWTLLERTNRQSTSVWAHYTPHHRYSIGWRSEWDRSQDTVLHGLQLTTLAKRWFAQDHQANIYAFAGAGILEGVNDNRAQIQGAGFVGAAADWETRRWYASYTARMQHAEHAGGGAYQAARVGVAPYVGDMGDLHTWLMLEIDQRPDMPDALGVTPLIRFFKGSALLELGWSVTDDQPLVNFAYRF